MIDALGSTLFYIGALACVVGLLNLIRPFRWSRIRTRRRAAIVTAAPRETPILDVALAGGFVLLGEKADREILLGALVIAPPRLASGARRGTAGALDPARFRTLGRPGFARAVMNFRVVAEADGWTRVTTETRVQTVDAATRRQFTRYWRAIFPGSWIIRWSWLRAIEARLPA